MAHSNIVGGSTAKRVIHCPASVQLAAKMPSGRSNSYADKGTLLHNAIALLLSNPNATPESLLGMTYKDETLTHEDLETKIQPALAYLDELDPSGAADMAVEAEVSFPDLPGVFGSCDLLMRVDDTAIVLDWKFGDGVIVDAEDNYQLLFYAAAAMVTERTSWVFTGATEVVLAIVQPPDMRPWRMSMTEFKNRVMDFRYKLNKAVDIAQKPDAPLAVGDWCKWCPGKALCPEMTGAVDRALRVDLQALPLEKIGTYLAEADVLEDWIKDLRALALTSLENGVKVPGYKLVAKRGQRKWVNEDGAKEALLEYLPKSDVMEESLISPAVAEKLLKKQRLALPEGLAVSVSSGHTLAAEDDPRPAVVQIGQQLAGALSKLV